MKNIKISVIGSYSSGKSRILNDIIGVVILPYSIEPIDGHPKISLFPHIGRYLPDFEYECDKKLYSSRKHGLQASFEAENVEIGIPYSGCDNISMLETRLEDIRPDEQKFLNESDCILYILDIRQGLPTKLYLEVLNELKGKIYVIISKSDTEQREECYLIKRRIQEQISRMYISVANVFLYSCLDKEKFEEKELKEALKRDLGVRIPFRDCELYLNEVRENIKTKITELKRKGFPDLKKDLCRIVDEKV